MMKNFWQPLTAAYFSTLHMADVVLKVREIDDVYYQRGLSGLLADPLAPPSLPTLQAIRLISRNYERMLLIFIQQCPQELLTVEILGATTFCHSLKLRTNLGHLCLSIAPIISNSHMLAELVWNLETSFLQQ